MAHNDIVIFARLHELKVLADATVAAYLRGDSYLVPGSPDAPCMTSSEALVMLHYQLPTEHCLSGGARCNDH